MKIIIIFVCLLVSIEILALFNIKHSVGRYRMYWNELAAKPRINDELLYVALGDSAAQGVGATSPAKGYVGLISDKLSEKTNKTVHVINLSVSGAKLKDVIDIQLPQLEDLEIDSNTILTLAIGGNDMSSFDEIEFRNQIELLFAELPKQIVVADIGYFGGGRKRNLEMNVLTANKIITEYGNKNGIQIAKLHKTTLENDSIWTMSADFFHPSNRGYINWFVAFSQALNI